MSYRARVLFVSIGIFFLSGSLHAAAPLHEWSQRFGDFGNDVGNAVVVDDQGNVIVTGYFEHEVDFGGGSFLSAGTYDIFVAKYDSSGAHLWSRRAGGTSYDEGLGVAVDVWGNVIVTGYFRGTADFGGGDLVSAGDYDIFLAKYNAAGSHLWSQRFGGIGGDYGRAVAVDSSGNVVVTGNFIGTADLGGGILTSAGGSDIFVAKYDADGTHLWSQRFGDANHDNGRAVAVDSSGNVLVTGLFRGTADFGGGGLVSAGLCDIVAAKYDPSGDHLWSRRFGSTGDDFGLAVAVDSSGSVVLSGFFSGTVDFGGDILVSAGGSDVFVAKYDTGGVHQWSRRFGGTTNDEGLALVADNSGSVTVTGYFQGAADFGGGDLTSAGAADIFLAKYNANGAHRWSKRFGSGGADRGCGVAADGSDKTILTGSFEDTVSVGGGDLVSDGHSDVFVAKYVEDGSVPVLINAFDAVPRAGAVEVTWWFFSDEALDRVTLYRRHDTSPPVVIATGEARTTHSYTDRSVEPGETYHYELVVRTASGDEFRSPSATVTVARLGTSLAQNYPNPFNPETTISFTLAEAGPVTLAVYDVEGRLVSTLVDRNMDAGFKEITWDGKDAEGRRVSSGVYYCRLHAEKRTYTKSMVLLK